MARHNFTLQLNFKLTSIPSRQVIERAKEGETLEELRARTAAQFVDEHTGFQRLSKKRKQNSLVDEGSVKFSRIVE